jgi:hypothetical protein
MNRIEVLWTPIGVLSIGLLLALPACTSKSSPVKKDKTNYAAPTNNTADRFDGGTYCVQTFLQGPAPAQPLHFSNQITESDQTLKSKDFQADLSGDALDIVHRDQWLATDDDRKFFAESQRFTDPKIVVRAINNGVAEETVTNHVSRSDQVGWRGGVISIAQAGTPWGLFIFKPPVTRVGDENVNGYATVKYTVDTTHESEVEKSAGFLRQLKDYNITGTAWVLKEANCVLKYDINDEQVGKDGSVKKTHYEGTVTKKDSVSSDATSNKSAS